MFTKGLSQFVTKTKYEDLPKEGITAAKFAIIAHIGMAERFRAYVLDRCVVIYKVQNRSVKK